MTSRHPTFTHLVLQACEEALLSRGYVRPRKDNIVLELGDNFLGWIGLNVGRHREFTRINPFVGIHWIPVMQMSAELAGEKYQRGRFATLAVHLGELLPDVQAFEFSTDSDVAGEAQRLALAIDTAGKEFMRTNASPKSAMTQIKDRIPMLGGYPQRYASGLYLAGEAAQARSFVEQHIMEIASDKLALQSFKKFSDPFLAMSAA
jgi:hypothetical protein